MRLLILLILLALPTLTRAADPAPERLDPTEKSLTAPLPWDPKSPLILSATRDPYTHHLWVGTEDSGVFRHDGQSWSTFTTKDGLPEDSISSLAVDRQGRCWAGHLRHGVSVFDGKTWRNYDSLTGGPLGSHVFAITVCPAGPHAGEVWIATDAGLARYSSSTDTWSYVTRADGLPSDQIHRLAFDNTGRCFAATQCDGLAIASPADEYATWTHVDGPLRAPTISHGFGLPSAILNDLLVTRAGVLYVATNAGLAQSSDAGKTFTYRRGADWLAKAKQRTGGPPADLKPDTDAPLLAEDYITALAEDDAGLLWLGYRTRGFEALDESTHTARLSGGDAPAPNKPGDFVTTLLPIPAGAPLIGTYGHGLLQPDRYFILEGLRPAPTTPPATPITHPSPAKPPSPKTIDALLARLRVAKGANPAQLPAACFLADDWTTQGDAIGRYGRQVYSFPAYGVDGWVSNHYPLKVLVGPHQSKNKGGPYTYYATLDDPQPRVPWIPNSAKRNSGEWNDGSFDAAAYSMTWEGPDLWLDLAVPAGTHRLGLYFLNYDGHSNERRYRDYVVEIKAHTGTLADADFAPALARTRVKDFYPGVMKQFVLAGPAQYYVKINRNYSAVTKVSACFLDRLEGPPPAPNIPDGVPIMSDQQVQPPPLPPVGDNVAVRAAADVIAALDSGWSNPQILPLQRAGRTLALRLAAAQGADPALLANWRFRLPFMTAQDHADFTTTTAAARDRMLDQHPHTIQTPFRAKMAATWKQLQAQIKAGQAPDPAEILQRKPDPTKPDDIKSLLTAYLQLRAGKQIDTRSYSTDDTNPATYYNEFKGLAASRPELYRLTGEYLLYSEGLATRPSPAKRRQALATALAATRASIDLLDDTWLAARTAQALLIPQLKNAPTDTSPLSRQTILATIIAAHTNNPTDLPLALDHLLTTTPTPDQDPLRLELARALHTAHNDQRAATYLNAIPPTHRTADWQPLHDALTP